MIGANKVVSHLRPYANEAIAELTEEGDHREAAFWLAAWYSFINAIIQNDASEEERAAVQVGFDRLLASLDLLSPTPWPRRVQRVRALADEVCGIADSRVAGY